MRKNKSLQRYLKIHKFNMWFLNKKENFSFHDRQFQAWLISLLYTTILLLIFFGPLLRARKFNCHTNRQPVCPDFVIPELKKNFNQILYIVPKESIEERLRKNIPVAQSVRVMTRLPNVVEAHIQWQEPIAQVAIPASSSAYLVAESGHIIGMVDAVTDEYPTIIADAAVELVISDKLTDTSLSTGLDVIKHLTSSKYAVDDILIQSPLEINVRLRSGMHVTMTSTKPAGDQVRALQLILAQSTINASTQMIDLRPDRPIIKPVP